MGMINADADPRLGDGHRSAVYPAKVIAFKRGELPIGASQRETMRSPAAPERL
jgi:hypothetical protein